MQKEMQGKFALLSGAAREYEKQVKILLDASYRFWKCWISRGRSAPFYSDPYLRQILLSDFYMRLAATKSVLAQLRFYTFRVFMYEM